MSNHDKPRRLTDAEYAEMADDYEANPPTADEIAGTIDINPAYLRTGRPTKGTPTVGKTPVMALRLPESFRLELKRRVDAGEAESESALVRIALADFFDNNPTESSQIYVVENSDGQPLSVHRTEQGASTALEFTATAAKIDVTILRR